MAKYYFLKTTEEGGRRRLIPLPHQRFEDGEPVNHEFHVTASRSIREAYPLGTVFGTEQLMSVNDTHYSAKTLYPVNVSIKEIKYPEHVPSEDMVNSFCDFTRKNPTALELTIGPAPEAPEPKAEGTDPFDDVENPKPKTMLERMREMFKRPTISKNGFYVSQDNWEMLTVNIANKLNTLLTGPSGTGKTELVMEAARAMDYECCIYDMGSMHDPMTQMLGTHRIDADHKSSFDYAQFVWDVSSAPQDGKKGRVILLDELSRAPVNTLNILFPCLDNRRMLPVEMAGEKDTRKVAVHPDVVFVATANLGTEYTGAAAQLDKALQSRFLPMPLTYMPNNEEEKVLVNRWGIAKEDAHNIVSVCDTIRGMFSKGTISCDVSTRESLAVARYVSFGYTVIKALSLLVLPLFEGTDTEGERSLVRKTFMTC